MIISLDPDCSFKTLKDLHTEFHDFCDKKGLVSETDTRVKLIDRILHDVLFWPEKYISREDHAKGENNGFTDYQLTVNNRPYVTAEAKREGISFELPKSHGRKHLKVSTLIGGDNESSKAIKQVRQYCDDLGIRYSIATNGYTWIIFRALREDMPWREGYARIFYSMEDIIDNFAEFWNLLSYEALNSGSLDKEFSSIPVITRKQVRIIDKLYNANLPLERNRLHAQLDKFIEALFKDIADQEYLKILESCYVYSRSLQFTLKSLDVIIKDTIPKFLKNEGTIEVRPRKTNSGIFQDKISKSIESKVGELYLLLGGIGSGKTTFIKRYFRLCENEMLKAKATWFYVSLLGPPANAKEIENFIYNQILVQLRENYSDIIKENRKTVKKAFKQELTLLYETTFKVEGLSQEEYERRISPYLEKWQNNLSEYVPRLLQLCQERNRAVIICIDNVDQLLPESQAEVFLLAQNITRKANSITILALREETYYTARIQKIFSAYSNQKFHISSPNFMNLIDKRLKYAKEVLSLPDEELKLVLKSGIYLDKKEIVDFFNIIEYSVFDYNKHITRFIESICFGNMRKALDMFSIFLISGATDVDKMLKIYRREGNYFVPFHEFIKSVMLEDRRYYKESHSKIMNIYSCSSDRNSSHFTAIRLLKFLVKRISVYESEGQGYVDISKIVTVFDEVFDNREDLINSSNRLLKWGLIEVNTRSTDNIAEASYMRITSAGWYYLRYLIRSFVYLDLVLQDTPIDEELVVDNLLDLMKAVDNLAGKDEEKIKRTDIRFKRVDIFLSYLHREEENEYKLNKKIESSEEFSERNCKDILDRYQKEKEWIGNRLKENAEKYVGTLSNTFEIEDDNEIEQLFVNTECEENASNSVAPRAGFIPRVS